MRADDDGLRRWIRRRDDERLIRPVRARRYSFRFRDGRLVFRPVTYLLDNGRAAARLEVRREEALAIAAEVEREISREGGWLSRRRAAHGPRLALIEAHHDSAVRGPAKAR